MQKLNLLTVFFLFCTVTLWGQIQDNSYPRSYTPAFHLTQQIPMFSMDRLDMDAINKENQERDSKGILMFNGRILSTQISTQTNGVWDRYPNGDQIWRARVQSVDAKAMALYFSNFYIPDGAKLYVYSVDKTQLLGGFTSANNHESGQFALGPIHADDVIVEYYEPAKVAGRGHFTIDGVGHLYRMVQGPNGFGDSDPCQVNVNCSEGNGKTQQRDAVARILVRVGNNSGWCSGSMVNNTLQNCNRYFLTALHCALGQQGNNNSIASAANFNQWIFYFNYQGPGCSNPASQGTLNNQALTGAAMLSHSNGGGGGNGSDFLLLELNSAIPASYNIFYAGWDAGTTASTSGYSIHHPSGDIKKISTYTGTLVTAAWNGSGLPSHWRVVWAGTANGHGVTEGGSSGSPIFNASGRIVGTLTGGGSFCTATSSPDLYGKMSYHWTTNGAANNRQLKAWLDPNNSGVTSLAGTYYPCTPVNALDAGISAINNPADSSTICDDPFAPEVVLENFGTTTLTSVTINYQLNTGTINSFSWTGSLASAATTTVTLPLVNIPAGGTPFTFRAYTSTPNGGTDANNTNDETSVLSQYRTSSQLPYAEAFGGGAVPTDVIVFDQNNDGNQWVHNNTVNGFGAAANTGCMTIDNFTNNFTGQFDWFFVPTLDLTGQTGTMLTFDVAYARYNATYNDTLIVAINSDCGTTYTPVYWQGGSDLATAPDLAGNTAFSPTAGQWRTDSIDLSAYDGQSHVAVAFINFSGYGHPIYVDNINIQSASGCSLGANIASSDDVDCNGGTDGAVTINATGGSPAYTYNIGNGNQANGSFSGLAAGTYTVTVTDASACTMTVGVSIGQPAVLNGTITSSANVNCFGGNTGSIALSVTGGTPTYSYDIGNGQQGANTFSGLGANNYVVTITDANSCETTVPVTINGPTSALVGSINSSTNPNCAGTNSGSITVAATGGTAPYSYNAGTGSQGTATINNLGAGSYTVTIVDANNCVTTTSATTLTDPAALVGTATDNGNGTATATASGGAAPYTYQWDAAAGNQTSATATNLAGGGSYTVTITDANNCMTTATVTVITGLDNIPNLSTFNVLPNPNNGLFQIEVAFDATKDANVQVTNVLGQVLKTYNFAEQNVTIPVDLAKEASGVYFVVLQTGDNRITRKVTLVK